MDDRQLRELLDILVETLHAGLGRRERIAKFQGLVWDELSDSPDPVLSILRDLAYDLDFYEASPRLRAEDPVFYGDERLEAEILEAFDKLREAGVDVPRIDGGVQA